MADDESVGSPWDPEPPSYREVPPIHPKTHEPVKLYVCELCGAVAVSRKIHSTWHRSLAR